MSKIHQAKLVFFDNIYMYDPDYLDAMTEETPIRPVSKKGVVREKIARMLLEAGGSIIKPIFSFPGGRRFHFTDPNGNEFAVWSNVNG